MKLFIKRLVLIILGIVLSLILLECGLRFAGWTIFSYQQYKNNKALRNKSQYTIMCLGESTTAGEYPIQLQKILDEKYSNKFSIIDCGIGGTDLETILSLLDNNIKKYNPNIAICMMGINNGLTLAENLDDKNVADNIEYIKKHNNINLKIYKLFVLLKKHLISLLKQNDIIFAEEISNENNLLFEYAMDLIKINKFNDAKKILKNLVEKNPKEQKYYLKLAYVYKFLDYDISYNMAVNAFNKNFTEQKEWYYEIILGYCSKTNKIALLKHYIEKAINEDFFIFSSHLKYYLYSYIKDYISNEQKEKILKEMVSYSDKYYGLMTIEAIKCKKYRKAKEYLDKAEEIRLNFPNIETYNLYKLIIKKLVDNNIKVICMQYPVRNIKPLQEQLKNELYYDKITFISNEKNFKNTLMKKDYDEIFEDQFAGDFGHCTYLGNTMIAENVVNTLENILDLKQN